MQSLQLQLWKESVHGLPVGSWPSRAHSVNCCCLGHLALSNCRNIGQIHIPTLQSIFQVLSCPFLNQAEQTHVLGCHDISALEPPDFTVCCQHTPPQLLDSPVNAQPSPEESVNSNSVGNVSSGATPVATSHIDGISFVLLDTR